MYEANKHKFLFKCDECEMIVTVEFDEQDDLDQVQENKMVLECPCKGHCKVLRN